jgi:CO/xanthine dehydrogenase FAD-binding subunit
MIEIESGRAYPDLVLDVRGIPELRGVRPEAGGLRLGALTTCSELRCSELVHRGADVLAHAAGQVGAVQIQNRATLGGNLGTASPAADLVPVLFALGARVRIAGPHGQRELPVEGFVLGYRRTALGPGELIESVWIPPRPAGERRLFRKVGTRRAQSIAKLVVALAVTLEGGCVASVRAGAGSLSDRTQLLPTLARELAGKPLDASRAARAARASAHEDVSPRTDVRSTAEYRRAAFARVLTTLLASLAP